MARTKPVTEDITSRQLLSSSLGSRLRDRTRPGVIHSSLVHLHDHDISYAQRYALGVPRISHAQEEVPNSSFATSSKPLRSTKGGARLAAEPARLRSSTGGTQSGLSSKARSPVRSPASKPPNHKTGEPPKRRAPVLASREALTLAVRSFMRSNSGHATWPAPAARVKPPVPAEVKNRPQGQGSALGLPTGVQRVILIEAVAEAPSLGPAVARQVSLSRSKALEGRMPSRLRRQASQSSDSDLHTAAPVTAAAEAGMAEVAKSTYQDAGSDSKLQVVGKSPSVGAVSPSPPPAAGAPDSLPAQPERLALTLRTHSTPDLAVLAFESRTDRLLNLHQRLEVQNKAGGPLAVGLPASPRAGLASTGPLGKRTTSLPTLHPIHSQKAMDFTPDSQSKGQRRPSAFKASRQRLKASSGVSSGGKKPGFFRRLFGCFSGGNGSDINGSHQVQDTLASPFPPWTSNLAAEPSLPLTMRGRLRQSITLLSSSSGSSRPPPLDTGMSGQTPDQGWPGGVVQPATLFVDGELFQSSTDTRQAGGSAGPQGNPSPDQLHRNSAPAGNTSVSTAQAKHREEQSRGDPAGWRAAAPRGYGDMHKELAGRQAQHGPLGAAFKAKARDVEAEEKQKPRSPPAMAAAALKSKSAAADSAQETQADPAQLPPRSLRTVDQDGLQPAPSATEVLMRELEELTLLASARSKAAAEALGKRKAQIEALGGAVRETRTSRLPWSFSNSTGKSNGQIFAQLSGKSASAKTARQLIREEHMLVNRKPLYQPPDRQAHAGKQLEPKGAAVAAARPKGSHAAGTAATSAFSMTAALADISGSEFQSQSDGYVALRQRSQDLEAWPAEQQQHLSDAHYISPLKLPRARPKIQYLRTNYAAQPSSGGQGPTLQPSSSRGGPSPGESPQAGVPVSTFSAAAMLLESATAGVLVQQEPEQYHADSRESNAASLDPPPGLPQPLDQDLPPAVQADVLDTKAGNHYVDGALGSSAQPSSPDKLAGIGRSGKARRLSFSSWVPSVLVRSLTSPEEALSSKDAELRQLHATEKLASGGVVIRSQLWRRQ